MGQVDVPRYCQRGSGVWAHEMRSSHAFGLLGLRNAKGDTNGVSLFGVYARHKYIMMMNKPGPWARHSMT